MGKKSKFKLDDLKVQSFVTSEANQIANVKGGIFSTDPSPQGNCITYDYGLSCDGQTDCGTGGHLTAGEVCRTGGQCHF